MKMTRQVACLAVALLLMIASITVITAQTFEPYQTPTSSITDKPVTYMDLILKFFGDNQFTIVGQDRKCSDYASFPKVYVQPGSGYSTATANCPGGSGLIDVYSKYVGDNVWYPRLEFQDTGSFTCNTAASATGKAKESCIVEIYCCPRKECTSDGDCSYAGTGSKCVSKNYIPQTGDGYPLYYNSAGTQVTTYKTCTTGCFGSPIKCYRFVNNECQYTAFSCDHSLYNNIASLGCAVTQTWPYTQSQCNSQMGQTCVPKTCTQLGRTCGSWSNGCTGTLNCGTCPTGKTCSSTGSCITSGCTPDNSCAANTCTGSKCTNNCNEQIAGTKTGGSCGTVGCTGTQIEVEGVCKEKSTICVSDGGTKDCTTPTKDDPEIKAQVLSITIVDDSGNAIPGNKAIKPADTIKINYKIKTTLGDLKTKWGLTDLLPYNWPLIVSKGKDKEYLIEIGIIPKSVAIDPTTGWFPPDKISGTYSIFQSFAVANGVNTECCSGQSNIAARTTKISDNGLVVNGVLKLGGALIGANTPDSTELIFIDTVTLQVPDSSLTDKCPVDGVSTPYWNEDSSDYILYLVIKNGCNFYEGSDTVPLGGYKHGAYMLKPIQVDVNYSGAAGGSGDGIACLDNADCESCNCASGFLSWTKKCQKESKCSLDYGTNGTSLIDLKKVSLTKEEITPATTTDLLASACLSSSECLDREDEEGKPYTVSCIKLNSLKAEGTLTQSTESFFTDAKGVISNSLTGAGLGAATALTLCALPSVPTGGIALIPCTAVGALVGGVIGAKGGSVVSGASTKLKDIFSNDDELTKAIKNGESNKVGICTAQPDTTFDIGGILKKIGHVIKITGNETTDGIIVIVGGLFILMFLFSMMSGKK